VVAPCTPPVNAPPLSGQITLLHPPPHHATQYQESPPHRVLLTSSGGKLFFNKYLVLTLMSDFCNMRRFLSTPSLFRAAKIALFFPFLTGRLSNYCASSPLQTATAHLPSSDLLLRIPSKRFRRSLFAGFSKDPPNCLLLFSCRGHSDCSLKRFLTLQGPSL